MCLVGTLEPHYTIPLCRISRFQNLRLKRQRATQYSYASFLLVNMFPKNSIHQRSVHRQTAIIYVLQLLDPL